MLMAPKLLSWYARKAGVSMERAGVLWVQAVKNAQVAVGLHDSSALSSVALEQLFMLLSEETGEDISVSAGSVLECRFV